MKKMEKAKKRVLLSEQDKRVLQMYSNEIIGDELLDINKLTQAKGIDEYDIELKKGYTLRDDLLKV